MVAAESFAIMLLIGIITGGFYALVGIGVSLIWGIVKVINLAHGEFLILAPYLAYVLIYILGLETFSSIGIAVLLMFVLGFVIERFLISSLRNRSIRVGEVEQSQVATMVLTLGLSVLMSSSLHQIFTTDTRTLPLLVHGSFEVFGFSFPLQRLLVLATASAVVLLLFVFLYMTKVGMAMRAVSQNIDAARVVGVDVERIYALAFGVSTLLAGLAGALITPITYFYPYTGSSFLVKGFIVTVLGGMGSIVGAFIGSFILGLAESMAVLFVGAEFSNAVGVLVMLLVLLIKPSGLLGVEER